jgi:hypothetical protein
MTSKSQYEKNLDAFAPYYYDDENHIDSLTPLIGNFRFATATKSGTTTRFFPLNICYYRLFIVLSFAYHIFIATVTPNHVLL